ncbi:MAG: hypothetical protein Q4B60_03715 [Erysipelotrichaceae bacterium]|nr:hypothetical protein [Erysipelotrichaceae bacterium]
MDTLHIMINRFINLTYRLHTRIMTLNDNYEMSFNDKQLHFLVIGLFGVALFLFVYLLFKLLEKMHMTIVSAWIYTFTVLVGITFAIEIAQGYSHTGIMEFADITAGLKGFFLMSFIMVIVIATYELIKHLIIKAFKKD